MLIFIPASDYSSDARQAETITEIDYEYIAAGQTETKSFRVGNDSSVSVTYAVLAKENVYSEITITNNVGEIAANEISDTISVSIEVSEDAPSIANLFTIIATDGIADFGLTVLYSAVGPNTARKAQYPDRASSFSNVSTAAIDRVSELLKLIIYEPIPLVERDPADRQIKLKTHADGTQSIFWENSVCERLSPTNHDWGYTLQESRIRAAFVSEQREIITHFANFLTPAMVYRAQARLVIPAPEELLRSWALFHRARGNDREQHKRTVYVIERVGELYSIENIIPKYKDGESIAYFQADCVAIHKGNMGSPDYFDPWSRTYLNQSDKPYMHYPCEIDPAALLEDIGSNASNASNLSNASSL